MNRRQKIIVSVVGIFIVLLALVGLTYAYFLTRINGNKNDKSITLTTAFLSLTYADDSEDLISSDSVIYPSFKDSKTFTVTNDGNEDIDAYSVVLEDYAILYANDDATNNVKAGDVATLDKPEDFEINMTCTAYKNYGKEGQTTVSDGCIGITNGHLPNTNDILVTNSIAEGVTHVYKLDFEFVETGLNQEKDMNKRIEGKINIIDPVNTVMITGTVEATDVHSVEISSEDPKVSYVLNGKYKVFGMAPDNHTMKMFNKAESLLATKTFSIVKGEKAGISGTTITVDENTESVSININSSKGISIESVDGGADLTGSNPFKSGTLAYAIYNSAATNSHGTEFRETPYTEIGNISRYHSGVFRDVPLEEIDGGAGEGLYYENKADVYDISDNYVYYSGNTNYTPGNAIHSGCNDQMIGKYTANIHTGPLLKDGPTEAFKVSACDGTRPIVNTDLYYESLLSVDEDNYGNTYYYRGNVKDNFVSFAGNTYRIVRIRGDEAIILIDIRNRDSGSLEDVDSILNNYESKFTTEQLSKLKSGNWCKKMNGSLKCSSENLINDVEEIDQYGDITTVKYVYASLLTSDEAKYAGIGNAFNPLNYLYDLDTKLRDDYYATQNAVLYNDLYITYSYYSYCPVIALKPGITITGGDGTSSSPYTVE